MRYFFGIFCITILGIYNPAAYCSDSQSKPKVAFLFLCYIDVYHQDYWTAFLKGYPELYSVYVYSKNGLPEHSLFKDSEILIHAETSWANTMCAQVELLEMALRNSENQKFVFVSESTIPIQNFEYVYNTIFQTEKSIFHYDRNPHQDQNNLYYPQRNLNTIPEKFRLKNAQWIILNRNHAELMVHDEVILPLATRYEADNELYPATFLAFQGKLFEVEARDMTYVNWERKNILQCVHAYPYIFSNLSDPEELHCLRNAINQKYLFARKIDPYCDLSFLDEYLSYTVHDSIVDTSTHSDSIVPK